jgi:hypothetical protein
LRVVKGLRVRHLRVHVDAHVVDQLLVCPLSKGKCEHKHTRGENASTRAGKMRAHARGKCEHKLGENASTSSGKMRAQARGKCEI